MPQEILFYTAKEPYGFLSNFYRAAQQMKMYYNEDSDVKFLFATNEHYYQSQKATTDFIKWWIASAPSPFLAMKAGHSLRSEQGEFRADWEMIKDNVMLTGLRAKFTQNPDIRDLLIDTGDVNIHEASPSDRYWGMKGQDKLGKMLMQVREELR